MFEMGNEQFSALTELLNFCRRALRSEQIDLKEWRRLRGRVNKALGTSGPPRIKADYGLISDLKKGVPVKKVAERYKVSRGTVYRMVEDHPELAKLWEEKRKKKLPDPPPAPVPDPLPVQPTQTPLPDVLFQFLASHMPKTASSLFSVEFKRSALGVLLSRLGLVNEGEFDALTDEELVARVTAHQSKGENQPDETRRDAVPSPPAPSSEAGADDLSFWVMVRDVADSLTVDETAGLIAAEITQHLDPFAGMGTDHPFFAELPSHVRTVLKKLAVAGRQALYDEDIPRIARDVVRRLTDGATLSSLPSEVLEFAALAPSPAEVPSNDLAGEVGD